jgi:hypothetical protein
LKRALHILILALGISWDLAQAQSTTIHPIVQDLLEFRGTVWGINHSVTKEEKFFELSDAPNRHIRDAFQFLHHSRNGLFLLPDGTGRVYQVRKEGNEVSLVRLDSTIYHGYTFGNEIFTYNDTLFSMGGFGYWRVNGHLRHYSPARNEWEIERLNVELPIMVCDAPNCFMWVDRAGGRLFRSGFSTFAPALKTSAETSFDNRVAVLDLKSKNWTELGVVEEQLGGRLCNVPWGELAIDNKEKNVCYLLDFQRNEVLVLAPDKTTQIHSYRNNPYKTTTLIYCRDSTLVFGRMSPPEIFTVELSRSDFRSTGRKVYSPHRTGGLAGFFTSGAGYVILWIVPAMFVLYLFVARRKAINRRLNASTGNGNELFNDRERTLIDLFLKNGDRNYSATIEEVNQSLGVQNKNGEVQKKHRSDLVLSINEKAKVLTGNHEGLIKKERTLDDKRSYIYYLDVDRYKKLKPKA